MTGNSFHAMKLYKFDKKGICQQHHNVNRHPLLYMRHKINKYILRKIKTLKLKKTYNIINQEWPTR